MSGSISIRRFVEIFSSGSGSSRPRVVTEAMFGQCNQEIDAALAALEAQISRLPPGFLSRALGGKAEGLRRKRELPRQVAGDDSSQYTALEQLKQEALAARDDAHQEVEAILTGIETHRRMRVAADAVLVKVLMTIGQIANEPGAVPEKTSCADALALLRGRYNRNETVRALGELSPFTLELDAVKTGAETLEVNAKGAVARWNELPKIDKALRELEKLNQKVVDAPLVKIVGDKLAALKIRRNELFQAAPGSELQAELALVTDQLDEISEAKKESENCGKWGEVKPMRQMILLGCAEYIKEGKKHHKVQLEQGALALQKSSQATETLGDSDPVKAKSDFGGIVNKYNQLKEQYYNEILRGPLLKEAEELAKQPDSAEAQMKLALSSRDYETRMLEARNTALAFGSPLADSRKLSPGEAVAIYTYTSNDYTDINGLLLGLKQPGPAEKAKIEIMIDQATKALAKLDNYAAGPTKRGEKDWPGADAQYKKDNEFTTKAFWSTGVGFGFPGIWQITINGRTGKEIKPLSNYPKEAEVLFPPGTKFKVLERDETEKPDTIYITVEEVV
jgi:hypothetical protein